MKLLKMIQAEVNVCRKEDNADEHRKCEEEIMVRMKPPDALIM